MVKRRPVYPCIALKLSLVVVLLPVSASVLADDQTYLYTRFIYEYQHTSYDATRVKDSLTGSGFFLFADYLDYGGITWGSGNKQITTRDDSLRTDEQANLLSGYLKFTADNLSGNVSLRVDDHRIQDDNSVRIVYFNGSSERRRVTDDVNSRSMMLSYLSYHKDIYADLAYSTTRFQTQTAAIDDLTVKQWSPALGFAFNQGYDWLQCRAFIIDHGDSNRISGNHDDDSYQFKWSHWLQAPRYYPHHTQTSLRIGKALMPVDYDAGAIYTTADVLTRALSFSATWKFHQAIEMLLFTGWEHYVTTDGSDNYNGRTLYMNLSVLW